MLPLDSSGHRLVRPVTPAAAYIGGKSKLAPQIAERIHKTPHRTYAEPFVGMGGVFLRRHFSAPVEVINDISTDITTLFRVLQRHYAAFLEFMRFQLTTRAEFERLIDVDPSTLTDLERAARFLYLQRLAFGGKISGRNFGVDPRAQGAFNLTRLAPICGMANPCLARGYGLRPKLRGKRKA